ncbi:MAG: hypothetical protein K2Y05_10140 [Hyphomicrobiaceae bacterium]|nr:hypothetical protein [Hyphomicrobiaceae bacterium]
MTFLQIITAWGVTALVAAGAAAILSGIKNRDYSFWMGWAFLFPPMVLVLAFLPRLEGHRPRQPTLDELDRRQEREW